MAKAYHMDNKVKVAFCNNCCMLAKCKSALRLKAFTIAHILGFTCGMNNNNNNNNNNKVLR